MLNIKKLLTKVLNALDFSWYKYTGTNCTVYVNKMIVLISVMSTANAGTQTTNAQIGHLPTGMTLTEAIDFACSSSTYVNGNYPQAGFVALHPDGTIYSKSASATINKNTTGWVAIPREKIATLPS